MDLDYKEDRCHRCEFLLRRMYPNKTEQYSNSIWFNGEHTFCSLECMEKHAKEKADEHQKEAVAKALADAILSNQKRDWPDCEVTQEISRSSNKPAWFIWTTVKDGDRAIKAVSRWIYDD